MWGGPVVEQPLRLATAANGANGFHTMPRCDMKIAAVRLARRSQNEAGFKRQSARLGSSPPSEIQSSWISGDASVPALRGNGGRALRLGTGGAVSTHSHLPARARPDAL